MNLTRFNANPTVVYNQVAMAKGLTTASRDIDPNDALRKIVDLPPVPIATKLSNLAGAAGRVVSSVVKRHAVFLTEEQKQERLSICRQCSFWNEKGNIGMGECRHPQCGCTRFKHGLSTETCPIKKW